MQRACFLITYDITNNKRRNRLHKLLEGYGHAVQKSCFETYITPGLYQKMLCAIRKEIDLREDNVRIYKIPNPGQIKNMGIPVEVDFSNLIII